MKKLFIIPAAGIFAAAFALMSFTSPKGDDEKGGKFPDNVSSILEKSCFPCHTSPGNKMAMMHVNMEKWNELSADKQEKKAGKMCKMVSKGAMPPKNFRSENPDKVPTPEQVKIICDWAASLKK